MNFKVGDVVIANEKSDDWYGITNYKNKWKGRITHIDLDGEFTATTIASTESSLIGTSIGGLFHKRFYLDKSYSFQRLYDKLSS